MNKLIENYNSSLEALSQYFECEYFGNYVIQECPEDYWEDLEEDIQYGKDKDNFDYSNEYKQIIRKEELTAVFVRSDFGNDDYWNIFYTKNEIKDE